MTRPSGCIDDAAGGKFMRKDAIAKIVGDGFAKRAWERRATRFIHGRPGTVLTASAAPHRSGNRRRTMRRSVSAQAIEQTIRGSARPKSGPQILRGRAWRGVWSWRIP